MGRGKSIPTNLAFNLLYFSDSDQVIPIPGTTQSKNFDENMASLHVHLSAEENAKIRKAVESAEVIGDRYPAAYVKA